MIISFEGLDGCGKTTQIKKLYEFLENSGKKVKVLREPGGNRISEMIRDILLDKKNREMCSETELLLYLASRAQLVSEEIHTLLEKGYTVILDRFYDSTTAYQGYGRELDIELINRLNEFVTCSGRYSPDITFFLDISVEVSFKRMNIRGQEKNRMETVGEKFFNKIRKGFLEIWDKNRKRVVRIDGEQSPQQIFSEIKEQLKKRD